MPSAPSVFAPPVGAGGPSAVPLPVGVGAGGPGNQQQQAPSSVLGPAQQARLADLLETVRKEFELLAGDAGGWKRERDDMESKIALQIQETALIRQNLYDLEAQHVKIRQDYEAEIAHLRRELEVMRSSAPPAAMNMKGGQQLGHSLQQHGHMQQQQQQPSHQQPILPQSSSGQPPQGGMHSPRRDHRSGDGNGADRRGLQAGAFMSGPLGSSSGIPAVAHSSGPAHHALGNSGSSSHPPPSAGSMTGGGDRKKEGGQQLAAIGPGAHANGGVQSLPSLQASAPPLSSGASAGAGSSSAPQTSAGSPPPSAAAVAAGVSARPPSNASSPRTTPGPNAGGTAGPLPSILSPLPASASVAGGATRTPAPSTPQPFASNPPPPPSRATPAAASSTAVAPPAPTAVAVPAQSQQVVVSSDIDPEAARAELKKEGSDWVVFWSPKAGKQVDVGLVHTLPHESIVCCVKFSHDGRWLATGCNRTVQIYDAATGVKSCVLQDESTAGQGDLYIRTICFSPDGRFLATGAEDRQIRIWDVGKRAIRHLLQGHSQEIYSLDFSSDGRHLVSGSGDQSARIWDIESGACTFDLRVEDLVLGDQGPVDAGLTSVAVSPDGRLVAAGSLDAVVRLWDAQTGIQLGRFLGHSNSVYSVAFSPDGTMLCSGSLDCSIRIWDLSLPPPARPVGAPTPKPEALPNGEAGSGFGACQTVLKGHKDYVLSVGVTNDGRWVVSGSKDRGVQFYDTKSKAVQLLLQGHKNSVISIDLSKNSGLLATGSGDLNARIWSYGPAASLGATTTA